MNKLQYMDKFKEKLKEYFNIFENYEVLDEFFPLYAKSLVRNERYIGSKKLVTDAYENHEHIFIQWKDEKVEKYDVEKFTNFFKSIVNKIVFPNEEHMSTTINGIYITHNSFTSEAIEYGENFKFQKTFAFGLKGWCDIGIILIDLNNEKIYTNKVGKKTKPLYQSIF
jgi:hypothetical protein